MTPEYRASLVALMHADDEIDAATAAAHVMFAYGMTGPDGQTGYSAGSFTTELIKLAKLADKVSLHRLMRAFPAHCAAVQIAKHDPQGVATLAALLNP
jgi:hypothetical protein